MLYTKREKRWIRELFQNNLFTEKEYVLTALGEDIFKQPSAVQS